MTASPAVAASYCLHYEANYWQAMEDFAASRPPEDKAALLRQYGAQYTQPIVEHLPCSIRTEAEQRRRQQMSMWQQCLDDSGVDFMMVMPLGDHVGFRRGLGDPAGIQNNRQTPDLPNALGWPMVTFPIGHGSSGVEKPLPINAAFWGPRFSEALLVQAAIDYQQHYPEHHQQAPEDPSRWIAVVSAKPYWPTSRENSTDPLVREGSVRP